MQTLRTNGNWDSIWIEVFLHGSPLHLNHMLTRPSLKKKTKGKTITNHEYNYKWDIRNNHTFWRYLLLFSHSVVCDPMDCRRSCPSLSPGVCSNSCPLSQWCHPAILSSVISFSSCLQAFPALGSFLICWLFSSGGQSIGASALAAVLSMNS